MLIFCLEKVAAAPGLAVGRKDDSGDSYRVRDLCIVVGEDGGRPLVVNITPSAYELRFLEVLMYEKAKKAILDEKDFSFAAARPLNKLEQSKIEEIEQLGAVYAQGGSRRSLVVDAAGPQEPAMALLSSLGVKLNLVGIGKQALDIGYVCLLLFAPDGRTEDKNKAQVRSAFNPIPLTEQLGTPVTSTQPPQAATVWQGPLPAGEVRVPPGSENLLIGGQQSVTVAKEEGGWGTTDFGDAWATPGPAEQGGDSAKYSFTPAAGTPPAASWQPPAAPVPDFAFAPQPASTFPSHPSDFQEELSHKTEFEQHLGSTDPEGWSPGVKQGADWAPTPNPAPTSDWSASASSASPVSDWGAPPAPLQAPSTEWASTASGGDWGAPPAPGLPSASEWGTPAQPAVSTGDWGTQPTSPSLKSDAANIAQQSESGSWNAAAAAGTTPGTGAWNTPWAQSPAEEAQSESEGATAEAGGADESEAAIPKKDANLFNRLYQQLAKGSPGASATNLPSVSPETSLSGEANPSPNASQTNLPRLSQELLSRTTAPQSPNASSTNLQPMDPELAAHFRIPLPPPDATPDATVALTPGQSAPQVISTPEPASAAPATPSFDWGAPTAEPASAEGESATGETGNEAPSWLESLDKKKATPYSTATNLKPPVAAPAQRRTPAPNRSGTDFELPPEFNLPADIELLRETGKIKMTPSMKDAVKRKSAEAAAKQSEAMKPQQAPESKSAAGGEDRRHAASSQPEPAAAASADSIDLEAAASSSASAWGAPPSVPGVTKAPSGINAPGNVDALGGAGAPGSAGASNAPVSTGAGGAPVSSAPSDTDFTKPKSKEEDPYKHLAEALSGLMSIEDGQPAGSTDEQPSSAITAENLTPPPDPLSPKARPKLSELLQEPKAAESAEDISGISKPGSVASEAPTAVPSRFAAMEAALSTHNTTPIKPLSIDAQSSMAPIAPTEAEMTSDELAEPELEVTEAPVFNENASATSADSDIDIVYDLEGEPETESVPAQRMLKEEDFHITTTRTDVPVLDDNELLSPAEVLDHSSLITSASDIPSLPSSMAAAAAAASPAVSETASKEGAPTQAAPKPARPAFQEPRLVMNEMVTLMNKLEQQVSKAAKKVSSRSEEIKQRLNKQVDDLIANASQVENQNQIVVQDTTAKLSKSLDSSTDEARQNISDLAANGRYSIKQMLTTNQQTVDDTKAKLLEDLTRACDDFRKESEGLAQECETFLGQFVKDKTDLIDATLNEITERLDETNASFLGKITARFERFKERMNDEASSIGRSLERNVHSMFEEIDGSWDRASEKLKLTKSEFEQTILHSVKTVELSASQNTRQILISSMAPQLRERTRRLLDLKDSQTKQFMSDTVAQSSLQLQGLESSLAAARGQLHTLVEDCVSNLDGVGRGQQAGLEEIFKTASSKTEKLTTEVQLAITDAQTRVQETELICKKLAENSSVDTDPELTDERNKTTQGIQKLKSQCNTQIQTELEDACMRLEQLSQKVQNESTTHRMHQTQAARDSSETGLNKIREAMQEAFSAIQTAREQNME